MVKSPYRPTSDSYGDRCGMLVFSCIKHKAITSLWALLEKPFDNLHFLQNISQKIQSLWEYLWGTILMTQCDVCLHALCVGSGTTSLGGRDGLISHCFQHCDVTSECEKSTSRTVRLSHIANSAGDSVLPEGLIFDETFSDSHMELWIESLGSD